MPGTDLLWQIVPPVLGVMLMVWSGWVVYRGVIAPRWKHGRTTCGRCGHEIVAPLPERCQECGMMLVEVGLRTPALAAQLGGGVVRVVLAWLMFSFFLGVAIRGTSFGVLSRSLTPTTIDTFSQNFTILIPGTTPTGPLSLTLSGTVEQRSGQSGAGNGTISMVLQGPPVGGVTPRAGAWTSLSSGLLALDVPAGRTQRSEPMTEADAVAVLVAVEPGLAGTDSAGPLARALAGLFPAIAGAPGRVHEVLNREFARQGLPPVSLTDGYSRWTTTFAARLPLIGPVRAETLAWAPAALLMLVGSVWVARRHRRLTAPMRASGRSGLSEASSSPAAS